MKETEIDNQVSRMLMQFEDLDNLQPSEGWNEALTKKLSTTKQISAMPKSKLLMVSMFFIILNAGFIVKIFLSSSNAGANNNTSLQTISKEFLINPISLNN